MSYGVRKVDYCGIYCITNEINQKKYIGQSQHCLERWSEHKYCAKDKNNYRTTEHLYRAIRKYGIKNFSFKVIEELLFDRKILTIREQYWMDYYSTLDPEKGYNEVPALDAKRGENCNFAVLTNLEAAEIVDLLLNTTIPMNQIAAQYGVSSSCIEDLNKGRRRHFEYIKDYPIRKKAKSIGHNKYQATLDNDIIEIRKQYVNHSLLELVQMYPEYGYSSLKHIVYGSVYKYLPIYKKREKKWIYPDNWPKDQII